MRKKISFLVMMIVLLFSHNVKAAANNSIEVEQYKKWTIRFNKIIDKESINRNIVVQFANGGIVKDVEINLIEDGKAVQVLPPSNGYTIGIEYTLLISKSVYSTDGKFLNKDVIKSFRVINNNLNEQYTIEQMNILKVYTMSKVISNHFQTGEGEKLDLGIEKVLNSKEANCAQEAYAIARYAEFLGIKSRLVGVFARNGLNHLLAEVFINKKWVVADGSNGIMYPYSILELVANNKLLNDIVGIPNDDYKVYTSDEFWDSIVKIEYHDVYEYEKPLIVNYEKSSDNFIQPDNSAKIVIDYSNDLNYAATIESMDESDTYILMSLKEHADINRIVIKWYDNKNYAVDYKLEGSIDGSSFFLINRPKNYEAETTDLEQTIFQVEAKIKYLKFSSTKYNGQQRLLIRNIKIYGDNFDWQKFINNEKNKVISNTSKVDIEKFMNIVLY